jgi:hypothetical protein
MGLFTAQMGTLSPKKVLGDLGWLLPVEPGLLSGCLTKEGTWQGYCIQRVVEKVGTGSWAFVQVMQSFKRETRPEPAVVQVLNLPPLQTSQRY